MAETPRGWGGLSERDQSRLRGWLWWLVCSAVWETGLLELFAAHLLPMPGSQKKTAKTLFKAQLYPPGGYQTGMIQCASCDRWTPRHKPGSGICCDCYYELLPPEIAARLSSASRIAETVPLEQVKEAIVEHVLRVRLRKAKAYVRTGVHWFGPREARNFGLAMLAEADRRSRSPRHRLYLARDPRVAGGPIDEEGVMRDPWLGYLWPMLPPTAAPAETGA